MEIAQKKKVKTRHRRRFPAQKREFHASFLRGGMMDGSWSSPAENRTMSPLPSRPDPETLVQETLVRLRYRSPVHPTDFRSKVARASQELQLNSFLVRQSLRHSSANLRKPASRDMVFKTAEGGESDCGESLTRIPPLTSVSFLVTGKCAASTAKSQYESPAPLRPLSVAFKANLYGEREKGGRMRRSDHFSLKCFDSDVIPKKPEQTVTLADIQKYLKYISARPFR